MSAVTEGSRGLRRVWDDLVCNLWLLVVGLRLEMIMTKEVVSREHKFFSQGGPEDPPVLPKVKISYYNRDCKMKHGL